MLNPFIIVHVCHRLKACCLPHQEWDVFPEQLRETLHWMVVRGLSDCRFGCYVSLQSLPFKVLGGFPV